MAAVNWKPWSSMRSFESDDMLHTTQCRRISDCDYCCKQRLGSWMWWVMNVVDCLKSVIEVVSHRVVGRSFTVVCCFATVDYKYNFKLHVPETYSQFMQPSAQPRRKYCYLLYLHTTQSTTKQAKFLIFAYHPTYHRRPSSSHHWTHSQRSHTAECDRVSITNRYKTNTFIIVCNF